MNKKEIAFSVALWTLSPQEKFNAIKAAKCTQAVSIYNSTISKGDFCCLLKTVFRFKHIYFRKKCWVRQTFCSLFSWKLTNYFTSKTKPIYLNFKVLFGSHFKVFTLLLGAGSLVFLDHKSETWETQWSKYCKCHTKAWILMSIHLPKECKTFGGLQEKGHEVNGGFTVGFSGAKTLNKADFTIIWAIHFL